MARETGFDSPLQFYTENPVAVRERLRAGEIDYLGEAADRLTDLHLLAAIQSGLLDEWARAFPDPRLAPQIPVRVLLAAAVAGAFAGEYALCAAGPALHSPAVLAELGYNVAWLAPARGSRSAARRRRRSSSPTRSASCCSNLEPPTRRRGGAPAKA